MVSMAPIDATSKWCGRHLRWLHQNLKIALMSRRCTQGSCYIRLLLQSHLSTWLLLASRRCDGFFAFFICPRKVNSQLYFSWTINCLWPLFLRLDFWVVLSNFNFFIFGFFGQFSAKWSSQLQTKHFLMCLSLAKALFVQSDSLHIYNLLKLIKINWMNIFFTW